MKVLVIMTGGTIGSKTEDNIIDVKSNSYHIIEKYKEIYGDNVQFYTLQPINKLSENFTLKTLEVLGNTILTKGDTNYDGIVVTHGSDTLAYTSSFIGMITRHFKIPIVLVASNYEISNPMANGLDNFHGAIQLIKSKLLRGCFVVWKDSITSRINVHISTRLNQCDSFTDNFTSFGGEPFAEIINDKVVLNILKINPTLEQIVTDREPLCDEIRLENKSMLISTYTGLDYSTINFSKDVKSIVIYLYHSGTACTVSGKYSLLEFINNNSDKQVYIASLKRTEDIYSTCDELLKSNAIAMYNINRESSYIKSLILNNLKYNKYTMENFFFEEV